MSLHLQSLLLTLLCLAELQAPIGGRARPQGHANINKVIWTEVEFGTSIFMEVDTHCQEG
jgi:hypothetical protein